MMICYINSDSVSDTGAMSHSILTSESKQPQVLFEIHRNRSSRYQKTDKATLSGPLKLIFHFVCNETSMFAYKTEFILVC